MKKSERPIPLVNPRCVSTHCLLKPRQWVDTKEDREAVKKILLKKP
jgi:hypothetical protein